MNNIIFHIGYPKSASTTLQHQFFTQLPGHYYLGVGMEKPHHNNQLVSENFKELVLNLFKESIGNLKPTAANDPAQHNANQPADH